MTDDRVREDIAFIREAIEQGQGYAMSCGRGMAAWGIAVAIGFVGTYGFIRGWSSVAPPVLWPVVIAIGWVITLGLYWRSATGGLRNGPIVAALRTVWIGLGLFLTPLVFAALWSGETRLSWLNAMTAGMTGLTTFVTASLIALPWLRWVALAWLAGALLLSAALSLALLTGPGLVLIARHRKLASA